MSQRIYSVGSQICDLGVDFRVWAPRRKSVSVLDAETGNRFALTDEDNGYFSGVIDSLRAGSKYFYLVDDDSYRYPDPASRFQPEGVHGPSEVCDETTYRWKDNGWKGVTLPGQVLYELHVGTFTPEGTWEAAIGKLRYLVDLGITVIEVMPVAEFYGDFGWGYDGVCWYAPTRLYGRPDDFRRFVDEAHQLGLAVILDVVYNHFGPTGNYTGAFSNQYVSKRHPTEWGDAINYDSEGSAPVRNFVIENATYWIHSFHIDGLRLDATQAIFDDSSQHLLGELSQASRIAAGDRSIILIAENESQEIRHVESIADEGFGLDGVWNDDFHHACRVAATGHAEYYYADFSGTANELLAASKWGYLYQGQYVNRSKRFRGTPSWHAEAWRFVHFLQNHDQVANSAHGTRLPYLTSPGRYRALTALWLLGPATPMFFMGQEFASTNPFLYFADHEVDMANLVREGRWSALRQFPRIAGRNGAGVDLADPSDRKSFEKSKLDWSELETNHRDWLLHQDLLRLRREDATFAKQDKSMLHGACIGPDSFLLRWFDVYGEDRLLLVNLGRDQHWKPAAEPLIAAPKGTRWHLLFSSEDTRYGGVGTAVLNMEEWNSPGHAAVLLKPV